MPALGKCLEVPYPRADNMPELDDLISERSGELARHLGEAGEGQVMIQFYDGLKKLKRKTGWFGAKLESETQRLWELWVVNVRCPGGATGGAGASTAAPAAPTAATAATAAPPGPAVPAGLAALRASFRDNLATIVDIVDTHKDHIPPITLLESLPFPYSIAAGARIAGNYTTQEESWGKYIKKMLD